MEDALTGAAASFKVALADALDLLQTVAVGEVDATSVTTGIDAAVQAADLAPAVEADASGVTTAIDDAVGASDSSVQVDADTSGMADAIDQAVASTQPEVQVVTDQVTDQINQAIADADTTIEVEADTGPAEDAIHGLGDTAGDASGKVGSLTGGVEGFRAASGLATGSAAGLEAGLTSLAPKAAGVAAAGAATATALGFMFNAALDSDTAVRRLDTAFGELAPKIEATNIPGFAKNLTELAQNAGQDDEKLRIAAARIGDFGKSAGVAAPQVANTAQQILLLGTHLAVTNPTLGQAGDVAETLTGALARGGRATSQFGIALTSAEINARALRDTGKGSADQLNNYEKAAAGAAIVTERLGSHLKSDIVEGAKGTEISLRSLREQFRNTVEDLAKPLLQPVVQAFRDGEPVLVDVAKLFGQLGTTALPLVSKAIQIADPLVHGITTGLDLLLAVARPLIAVVDAIPSPILATGVAAFGLSRALPALNTGLGNLFASAGEGGGIVGALGTAIGAINPITVTAGLGLFTLTKIVSDHAKARAEERAQVENATKALSDNTRTVLQAVQASDDVDKLGKRLVEAGISTSGLNEAIAGGGPGIRAYVETIAKAADSTGGLSKSQKELLLDTINLAGSFEAGAHATLSAAVANDTLGRAQEVQAIKQHTSKDGAVDWLLVLKDLQPTIDKASHSTDEFGNSLSVHTSAVQQIANSSQELSAAMLNQLTRQGALTEASVAGNEALHTTAEGAVDYAATLKDLSPPLADLVVQQARVAAGLDDVHTEFRIAADAADVYKQSVSEILDPTLNADQANIRFHDSLQRTADALLKSAGSLDITTEAGRRSRQAVDDLVGAGENYIEMLLRQGAPQAQVTQAKNDEIGALERLKQQYPQLTPVVDGYIAKIREIPPVAGTELQVTGADVVLDAVQRVTNAVRGLLGFGPVGVHLTPTTSGHAAGGDVFAGPGGLLVPVGEQGPETVFIPPNTAAHVFTAQQTRSGVAGGGKLFETLQIVAPVGDPVAAGFAAAREIGLRARRG